MQLFIGNNSLFSSRDFGNDNQSHCFCGQSTKLYDEKSCMMEKYSHGKLVMFFESFLVACTASFIELVKVWIVFICNASHATCLYCSA